jgi:hypothetical protein
MATGRTEPVTLRIETFLRGRPTLRLIGRIQAERLADLERCIEAPEFKPLLDLEEVTLVDVEAVRFLIGCEDSGIELVHCSPYIREWMEQEKSQP